MRDFIKKNKFIFYPINFIYKLLGFIAGIIIAIISFIEVPLFFIRHPRIFNNELIYVFWHWSFGHTISGIDYASRLYYPNRISLIYIPHPGSNSYLPFCFEHNMDVFVYKSIIPSSRGHVGNWVKYFCLRLPLFLLSAISSSGKFCVLDMWGMYKTLSLAKNKTLSWNYKEKRLEKMSDWSGYIRLLKSDIGEKPKLPQMFEVQCRQIISDTYPDFLKKPFVALLLRKKGIDFETSFRSAGPHENYIKAVRFLIDNGYNVVGTGETEHNCFECIKGYYSFKNLNLPQKLLNIFILINCKLFIGQQSGPHVLLNSCEIPCLICDAMPYRLGTFKSDDIILFKHLIEKKTGRELSLVEVFKKHKDLAIGYNFDEKGIDIVPNTPDEILEAVKECYAIIQNGFHVSDKDKYLIEKFRELPSRDMLIKYGGNRTSLNILHQIKSEFLN